MITAKEKHIKILGKKNTEKVLEVGYEKPHLFVGESGRWTEKGELWHRQLKLEKILIDAQDAVLIKSQKPENTEHIWEIANNFQLEYKKM